MDANRVGSTQCQGWISEFLRFSLSMNEVLILIAKIAKLLKSILNTDNFLVAFKHGQNSNHFKNISVRIHLWFSKRKKFFYFLDWSKKWGHLRVKNNFTIYEVYEMHVSAACHNDLSLFKMPFLI